MLQFLNINNITYITLYQVFINYIENKYHYNLIYNAEKSFRDFSAL